MNVPLNLGLLKCLVVIIGYGLTIATSGVIVRHFVGESKGGTSSSCSEESIKKTKYDLGAVIGKCENLLTISFILANALTGLALIFTAKSIVRAEDIKKDPRYYLGGTLVNFTYSVLMGFSVRIILSAIGDPA